MEKLKNETKVFELFIDKKHMREEFRTPIAQGNFVFATDSYSLIKVSRHCVSGNYPRLDEPDITNNFIPTDTEIAVKICELEDLLSSVEMVEEVETTGNFVNCNECDGDGTVEWEYKAWTNDFDCPVCNGSGYSQKPRERKTGRMIPDYYCKVRLGNKYIQAKKIKILIDMMELLGIYTVMMRYNKNLPNQQYFFYFDINTEVLMMPIAQEL